MSFIVNNKDCAWTHLHNMTGVCVCVCYLSQGLYAGIDVTAGHLGDDKVDGGRCAVVNVIKVWKGCTHPDRTGRRRRGK